MGRSSILKCVFYLVLEESASCTWKVNKQAFQQNQFMIRKNCYKTKIVFWTRVSKCFVLSYNIVMYGNYVWCHYFISFWMCEYTVVVTHSEMYCSFWPALHLRADAICTPIYKDFSSFNKMTLIHVLCLWNLPAALHLHLLENSWDDFIMLLEHLCSFFWACLLSF